MATPIDLNEVLNRIPACTTAKTDVIEIPAGKEIKIEISPAGEEIVYGIVPAGKKWNIRFTVWVEEVDA